MGDLRAAASRSAEIGWGPRPWRRISRYWWGWRVLGSGRRIGRHGWRWRIRSGRRIRRRNGRRHSLWGHILGSRRVLRRRVVRRRVLRRVLRRRVLRRVLRRRVLRRVVRRRVLRRVILQGSMLRRISRAARLRLGQRLAFHRHRARWLHRDASRLIGGRARRVGIAIGIFNEARHLGAAADCADRHGGQEAAEKRATQSSLDNNSSHVRTQ